MRFCRHAIISAAIIACLTGMAGSVSVELTWDRHPELDVTGYVAYWGLSTQFSDSMDVGKVERAQLDNLQDDSDYFFAVRAYDRGGKIGSLSNFLQFNTKSGATKLMEHQPSHQGASLHSAHVSIRMGGFVYKGEVNAHPQNHNIGFEVFDVAGRLVMVGRLEQGRHGRFTFEQNKTDGQSRAFRPGVYLMRISADNLTLQTVRILCVSQIKTK